MSVALPSLFCLFELMLFLITKKKTNPAYLKSVAKELFVKLSQACQDSEAFLSLLDGYFSIWDLFNTAEIFGTCHPGSVSSYSHYPLNLSPQNRNPLSLFCSFHRCSCPQSSSQNQDLFCFQFIPKDVEFGIDSRAEKPVRVCKS